MTNRFFPTHTKPDFTTPNPFSVLCEEYTDKLPTHRTPEPNFRSERKVRSLSLWPFDLLPKTNKHPQKKLRELHERFEEDFKFDYPTYDDQFKGWSPEAIAKMQELCNNEHGVLYFLHQDFDYADFCVDIIPENINEIAESFDVVIFCTNDPSLGEIFDSYQAYRKGW